MRTIADIDILGNEPLQARVAQLSLAVIVVTALVAAFLGLAMGGERLDVWWWVALAAGSLVSLPVHELVHAAAFKLLCRDCKVSFGFQNAFLYTKTDGAVLRRGRMLAGGQNLEICYRGVGKRGIARRGAVVPNSSLHKNEIPKI